MNFFASLVGLLEILLFLCLQTRPVLSEENRTESFNLAPRLAHFKTSVHSLLEGLRIRKKRRIQQSDELVKPGTPNHQLRVGSLSQEYGLSYLSDFNLTFWISFEHQSKNHILIGTQRGSMILYELSDSDDREANTVAVSAQEHIASKAIAFSYYDEQWFAVLQSSGGSSWLRFYQRVGRGLEGKQTIILDGGGDFDLVTVKGVHYLAVVTYRTAVHQSMLTLYQWTQTPFDKIAYRSVVGGRSVSCWTLDGSLYVVVAQEMNEEGDYRVGSPLFLYNAKDDDGLVLLQMLDTYGPGKVRYFFVSGSHYVIFFGLGNAAIYWWSSDQFLFWQRIEGTANASDAAVLALAYGEAMIVIAMKEEVYFYVQDFSGRYISTFSMSLPGHLASLQFMFSGKAYYALARFMVRPQSVWKLTLDTYPMPVEATFNPLHQCLLDVTELIEERQNQLEEDHRKLGKVWLKDRNQTVTAEVFVTGQTISSQDSAITVLLVVTDHKVLPDTSIPLVEKAILKIKSIVNSIQQSIGGSVLKSVEQKIIGSKHFVGAVTIPSLNLRSTSVDVPINGVHISRIYNFALRKSGNQTFGHPLTINHIFCDNVWTNTLNGIPVNDFLLLGGEQEVTGILKFSDIFTQNVEVRSVNSIPVESFITIGSDQIIRDLKNITVLQTRSIDVHGETNGEDLQKFNFQVVSILDDDEITAQCSVVSTLQITENFFLTGLVNNLVDLEQLVKHSVLKNTQQDLRGNFVFTSEIDVRENLNVSGFINGIDSTHLVTLSTDQAVSGDIIFEEQLTINIDLISNNINGIDLDKTVVKKTIEPQFVAGFMIFNQQLTAAEIGMTEYVTLDSVDPSLLVQEIVKHEEGVVRNHETVFHDVVVLGNLQVSEGVNGYTISDLPTTVWLKSRIQTIEVPMHIFKITAKADMEVKTVNTFSLDKDLVHSYKNETILSVKTFLNEVVVPTHVNTNHVIFNGLDTTSIEDEMHHIPNDGKIHGRKTLQTFKINGHISAELFNDLQVNELMHPTMPQEVKGEMEFLSQETVIQNVLFSDSINFNAFNGIDLRMFINNTVMKVPKYVIKNKRFWILEGYHLMLNEGSSLGGISFSGMLGRVVTLNTPQEISVQKTFIDYIQLEKSSSVSHLNDKPWNNVVGNVVFLDVPSRIHSQKAFTKNVQAGHVTIQEFMNGINITRLALTAFLKSRDNTVGEWMIFLNDIRVDNLDVQNTIDGLSWSDFIYTHQNEKLETVLLLSNAILGANMRIDGLLNGCNIVQLGQKAIYANETQFIKDEIIVQKLNIIGNLHMKEEVNHISIEDLQRKFVTIAGDQIITSDVQIGSHVKIVVLNLVDLMNDVDLTGIMNDAVRHSVPQRISGLKNFEIVIADSLTTDELFIVESLDGVDVNGVFNNAVWKDGDQFIDGEKAFISMKSNTVEVLGFINGLRLPEGVVMKDTSDRISGLTTFKSDITLGADIIVLGEINEKNLDNFISNRITLSGEQVVSSNLTFVEYVQIEGDLLIDETVNDLFLDLVCKVKPAFPLEGRKVFVDFYIDESLSVPSINGYDVMKMDDGILRYNVDEILNEVQVFESSLKVQNSLLIDWVNGKSLSEMVKSFLTIAGNYNRTLNYFDDLSYSLIHHINSQLETSVDRITRFAYFILVQDIDLGPTTKILFGHDLAYIAGEFSHSMVIWTSEKQCTYMERCCHMEFSYWMRIKKSGHLMIDNTPEVGKYYPIQNPAPITFDKDFAFWTDSTTEQSKWCNTTRSGELTLVSLKVSGGKEEFFRMKSAPSLSEVKSFRRGQHLYAVAGYYFNNEEDEYSSAVVYVFNEVLREWHKRQYLPSYGVLSLDITHNKLEDEILLAIGSGMGTYSSIYIWNDAGNEFVLLQNIPPKYVTSTLWMNQGSDQLLAMSSVDYWTKNKDCSEFLSGGQVDIFVYNEQVKWIQSIPLRGVVSMISLTLTGDTFLVAASHQLQSIFVYEWKGYAGFSLIQSMFVGEVRHLNTYTLEEDIYITVAVTNGPSKLLKVVSQGKHAVTVPIRKTIVPRELKDEASEDQKLVPGC